MTAEAIQHQTALSQILDGIVAPEAVIVDDELRTLYSGDVYSQGPDCAGIVRPSNSAEVAAVVKAVTAAGYTVIGRGGGISYTSGYMPVRDKTVIVDLGRLNRIVEVSPDDMFITVEAGVTWKQIYDCLKPLGLRLPFFGTFSGLHATVGGGLSQGALFLGTARYGQGADILLGLEVVLADGSVVRTGQAGHHNGRPFYRTYGPDLTGMFTHDGGAFGLKTRATLRLIEAPALSDYLSFVFPDAASVSAALSDVARSGAAEEAYVFDPGTTQKNLANPDLFKDFKTLANVVKGQGGFLKGLREGARLVASGRDFIDQDSFSMHVVCAGRTAPAVAADMEEVRARALRHNGAEIPNSIPKATRASLFQPLNNVLGPEGERWAALNAKIAHSDATRLIGAVEAMLAEHRAEMEAHGIYMTYLFIAISNHAFSYEPVFNWHDEWLPLHRAVAEPSHLRKLPAPKANPEARALVQRLRIRIMDIFREMGASSNQIGKSYPYLASLEPGTRRLIEAFKKDVDPRGMLNPGVLGLAAGADARNG